jgi:sorbitol/mannitol transport system substrate-binding protein
VTGIPDRPKRWPRCLGSLVLALIAACPRPSHAQTTLTIATVNNPDMVRMQRLSSNFMKEHPDIRLNWVVLEENLLRAKTTADITTGGGQYDVMTIGPLEAPIWGSRGWLLQLDDKLAAGYDLEDILKPVRSGLSNGNRLYALPFTAESSLTFYRPDLFLKAGLKMPAQPTYDDIRRFAAVLNDAQAHVYGVCLRGKPGWGENMAYIDTLVNTFGGRWFDMNWNPQINTSAWRSAISYYVRLLQDYGPPTASSNGFNQNLTLFENGHCAMWVDATTAAGTLYDPKESAVANNVAVTSAPVAVTPRGSHLLWTWALAIPSTSRHSAQALEFVQWATSKQYVQLVGETYGWTLVPPGTRKSTYEQAQYLRAAPFAQLTLDSILTADPRRATLDPVPYVGIQFVGIPQFPNIGTQVGQLIAAAVTGLETTDQVLATSQAVTERVMRRAGYIP